MFSVFWAWHRTWRGYRVRVRSRLGVHSTAFTVLLVEVQDELTEGIKGSQFQMVNHLVLEMFQEGQVCMTEQHRFTVFITESRDDPVEFHKEPKEDIQSHQIYVHVGYSVYIL